MIIIYSILLVLFLCSYTEFYSLIDTRWPQTPEQLICDGIMIIIVILIGIYEKISQK